MLASKLYFGLADAWRIGSNYLFDGFRINLIHRCSRDELKLHARFPQANRQLLILGVKEALVVTLMVQQKISRC
jgi:hypothetical protein